LITSTNITKHHEYLQTRPNKRKPGALSESHINHHVYALKLFFKWLEANGKITSNPISGLEFPTPKQKAREILSLKEIKQLYNACETYKERVILSIYYGCGLRRAEGIQLDLKDVHFRTSLLYVREGKGAKRRVVPMNEQVKQDLYHYVLQERKAKANETSFLVGQMGRRMNPNQVIRILKKLLEKTGIEKEITLHGLRHSIATHLLENGLSVENVRDFLGHSHLESTQIYTRINKQQLGNL
jgi:integrase/recombinase XerD